MHDYRRSVIHTPEELHRWFFIREPCVALDTETTSLKYTDLDIVGMSLCDSVKSCYIDLLSEHHESLLEVLREEIPKIERLVMHNAPFDMKVMRKLHIPHTEDIFCTMTAAHLLDENGPKGLKDLAVKLLGVEKTIGWEEAAQHGFKSPIFYKYATLDAEWTMSLYLLMGPQLKDQQLDSLFYDIEMPFQFVLCDLEVNGVLIDQTALSDACEWLRKEIVKQELECYKAGNIQYRSSKNLLGEVEYVADVNLGSPTQLSEFIRSNLKVALPPTKSSECAIPSEQRFSTDKKVLEGLKDTHPFFSCLLKYRASAKLLSAFLEKLPAHIDGDGRVRASFNNCVAVTGRLSCSSPNLQQLPRPETIGGCVRECIIAKDGYVLIGADYDGQELRVLAEETRDITMISAFIKGQDLHLTVANSFFQLGIPDDCLFTAHPQHKKCKAKFKPERTKSKTINFGLSYGKTAHGFAKDWNITLEEAERVVNDYFAKFPRIKEAIDACATEVDIRGYVTNLAGRRRRLASGKNRSYRQAFNFKIQGYSADMMKTAAVQVRRLCKQHPEWDCRIVLTVHDELVYEIKEEYADEAMKQIKQVMEHAVKLCVPLIVSINKGKNYAEAK